MLAPTAPGSARDGSLGVLPLTLVALIRAVRPERIAALEGPVPEVALEATGTVVSPGAARVAASAP